MTPDERPESYRLLFVCTGNTCRSPLAEALARREAERRGWTHVEVRSAGVAAGAGQPASSGSLRVAEEHGIDLGGHGARPLTADLVEGADLILAMSPHHLVPIGALGGGERATLLGAFAAAGEAGTPEDDYAVPDPFGGGPAEYHTTFETIEHMVKATFDRLEALLSP